VLPLVPRLGVALLLLPGCFNPTGATSTGGAGPTTGDVGETSTDTTSTGDTTPPTTLPSMTEPTTAPVTTTDPVTTTMVPPAFCGDGNVDPGEACDDGNNDNTDDCLDSCALAFCGDGFVHGKLEGCDAGLDNAEDAPCTPTCTPAVCGDKKVCPECGEECDGGLCDDDCTFKQRYVFVTSNLYQGSLLGGLQGADEQCINAAGVIDLLAGRKFVAWLSSSGVDAKTRIGVTDDPYVRIDGQTLAVGTADFLDITTPMMVPIDLNENSLMVTTDLVAWTGTQADGLKSNASEMCGDWQSGEGTGRKGTLSETGVLWTDDGTIGCNELARLYCVQVAPPSR
jgi:hypothetical protein